MKGVKGFPKGHTPWNKGATGLTKHTEESKAKLREAKLGDKNPNYRKTPWNKGLKNPYSQETLKAMSDSRIGRKLSEEHRKKIGLAGIGRTATEETRKKISYENSGSKNWNWRGGRTSLRLQIYKSHKTRQWRKDVFTRDDWTCQDCGARGVQLEAHHIKEFYLILVENRISTLEHAINCVELWDTDNGITLCENCHNKTKQGPVKTKAKSFGFDDIKFDEEY